MAKFNKHLLFVCFLSGAGAILSFISLGTQRWIHAKGQFTSNVDKAYSKINYGLFSGTYYQSVPTDVLKITMTCSFSLNICALLCAKNAARRAELLEEFYTNDDVDFEKDRIYCPKGDNGDTRNLYDRIYITSVANKKASERTFLSAIWRFICLVFLVISGLFGTFASGISVWNVVSNPVEIYFNKFGLYIYNSIACGCQIFSVIIWVILFNTTITHDISLFFTLNGEMNTDGMATLGISFWLNILSIILYILSITFLYYQPFLINSSPKKEVKIEDVTPSTEILLF